MQRVLDCSSFRIMVSLRFHLSILEGAGGIESHVSRLWMGLQTDP